MDTTAMTLVISTLVAVAIQVAKRRLPAKALPYLSLVAGAVAAGAVQGAEGAALDGQAALQVIVGALLPTAIHALGLKGNVLGNKLQGKWPCGRLGTIA